MSADPGPAALPAHERWLRSAVMLFALVLAGLAIRHHLVAFGFPYPIAYGEGVIAQWLVDPGPLYPELAPAADPQAVARHNPYPPAGYAAAGIVHALGLGPMQALRLLSLLALVAVGLLLGLGPARGRPWPERLAVLALVVLAPLAWRYGSLGRFDLAAVACSLAAACCAARGGRRWICLGAVLGGLALAIKPTYLAGLVAVAAAASAGGWRWLLPAAGLAAVVVLVGPFWAWIDGQALGLHLVELHAIGWDPGQALQLWVRFAGEQPVLLGLLAWFLWQQRRRRDPWWWFAAAAVLGQVAALKTGADRNYQLELLVACGVAAACLRSGAVVTASATALRLTALQLLCYLPLEPAPVFTATYGQEVSALQSTITPGDEDRVIGRVIADEIEAAEGPILSEDLGYLVLAGRPVLWQPYQFEQLRRRGRWSDAPLLDGVAAKRYGLIILRRRDSWFSPELQAAVAATYTLRRQVGPYLLYTPDFGF